MFTDSALLQNGRPIEQFIRFRLHQWIKHHYGPNLPQRQPSNGLPGDADPLRHRVCGGAVGKHARHLRGAAFL